MHSGVFCLFFGGWGFVVVVVFVCLFVCFTFVLFSTADMEKCYRSKIIIIGIVNELIDVRG